MNQEIIFENHYSARVMEILFPQGYHIHSEDELQYLKDQWSKNLKSWHSPYTCLFDLRNFSVSNEMLKKFETTLAFFQKFFMKKLIGFIENEKIKPSISLFTNIMTYELALAETPLSKEGGSLKRNLDDLRSRIQIENDFNAHVMEISFLAETHLNEVKDIEILLSKIKNILRMWHTPYSILINCVNCTFSPEAKTEFSKVQKFVNSFFCKDIVGYANKGEKDSYPFITYRSRHLAAAKVSHSGLQSGNVANCSTRTFSKTE